MYTTYYCSYIDSKYNKLNYRVYVIFPQDIQVTSPTLAAYVKNVAHQCEQAPSQKQVTPPLLQKATVHGQCSPKSKHQQHHFFGIDASYHHHGLVYNKP